MLLGGSLSKARRFGNGAIRLRIPQTYYPSRLRRPTPQFTTRVYSNSSLKSAMYPPIEPYFTGKLKVSDIHEL